MGKRNKFKSKSKPDKSKKTLFNEVLQAFRKHPSQTVNYKQLSSQLKLQSESQRLLLSATLNEMAEEGVLHQVERGKFKLKAAPAIYTGTVDMTPRGAAYVICEDLENDIFVPPHRTLSAFHGDTVQVALTKNTGKSKAEGEIINIVSRAKTELVGIIEINRNQAFLIPDNPKLKIEIFVPTQHLNGAKHGDKAVVKILEWGTQKKHSKGEVIRVLGKSGDNNTEMHAILLEYGLPYHFPRNVEQAAEHIDEEISAEEIVKRRDFRNITTFTIDPADAKDFDDAISVRQLNHECWEIGVHIADVSHYVQPDTLLDSEAYERATSVYLVDRVVPMLPEKLSNNVCSLRPNEDKLCFSIVFEMDAEANITNKWFGRTIINSNRRFAYEEAQSIIESGKGDYNREILLLDKLAKILREKRFNAGAIGFEKMEVKFKLSETGTPLGVYVKETKDSNKLIEEFMLLANRNVAEFVALRKFEEKGNIENQKEKKLKNTFVYRIHDSPNQEKLAAFSHFIQRFGYSLKTSGDRQIAASMNELVKKINGKAEANIIEQLAIRTMAKAVYTTKNIGHYGLAFEYYTHFTSPIRRYPDVLAHRLLQKYLDVTTTKKNILVNDEELEEQCEHSSEMERRAAEAERASIKYKQVEFMQDKIGQQFEGIISGLTDYGMFVELTDGIYEGMIRYRDVHNEFFEYDKDNFCAYARRSRLKYSLGDKLIIKVKRADLIKKQLDFTLVEKLI